MTKVAIILLPSIALFSFCTSSTTIFSGSEELKEVKEEPEEAKPDLVLPEGEDEDGDGGEGSEDRKRKMPSAASAAAASDAPTPPPSSSPHGLIRSGSVDLPLPSTSSASSTTTTVKQGSMPLAHAWIHICLNEAVSCNISIFRASRYLGAVAVLRKYFIV